MLRCICVCLCHRSACTCVHAQAKDVQSGPAKRLRVASACSGYDAPSLALEEIGVPFDQLFAIDLDRKVAKVLEHNYPGLVVHHADVAAVSTAALKRQAVDLDIFTGGFPCQPFSAEGLGRGTEDTRGCVFFRLRKIIKVLQPKAFVLENVKGLLVRHRPTFRILLQSLRRLKGYTVYWRILDSRIHSGIPQSRPRVYIVGIKTEFLGENAFQWPGRIAMRPLASLLEEEVGDGSGAQSTLTHRRNFKLLSARIKKRGHQVEEYVGDLRSGRAGAMQNCVPCLTARRAAAGGHYLFGKKRHLSTLEMFRLMGVRDNRIVAPAGVSEPQLRAMIGNSMDVQLVKRIFVRLLGVLGYDRVCDTLGAEGEVARDDLE